MHKGLGVITLFYSAVLIMPSLPIVLDMVNGLIRID